MSSSAFPRQFALDLNHAPRPSFRNFLPSGNEALIHSVHQSTEHWRTSESPSSMEERWIYWWGPVGAGRSHLLNAITHQADLLGIPSISLEPGQPNGWVNIENQLSGAINTLPIIITVDDVNQLDVHQEASLFRVLNLVYANPHFFIYITGDAPPAHLNLRDDLRTRLGWGLIFQIHPLSDSEKMEALSRAAKERGLILSNDVLPWLLHHFYRDMPSLMALLDALDTYSLETKRAITLPLVRELLQISGRPS